MKKFWKILIICVVALGFLGMVFPNKKELKTDYNFNLNGSK